MLRIVTAERGHTVVLPPAELPATFKALLEACPGAFGISLDFCIRLPLQDFSMDRADAVAHELKRDATWHFLKAAALSALTAFIVFLVARGGSDFGVILLIATALGALICWDRARRALKARKAYMSAIREKVAQGGRPEGEIEFVERIPVPPSPLVRVFIKSALVLFWIPVIGLGLAVAGVVGSRRNRGSGWRAAAIASLIASLIVPAGVVFAVWILPRLQ